MFVSVGKSLFNYFVNLGSNPDLIKNKYLIFYIDYRILPNLYYGINISTWLVPTYIKTRSLTRIKVGTYNRPLRYLSHLSSTFNHIYANFGNAIRWLVDYRVDVRSILTTRP